MLNTKKVQKSPENSIQVKILRFDPSRDKIPYWQAYHIPLDRGTNISVLSALIYIYEHLDSSLAFIGPCERGLCGACTIKIDGKAQLACKTFINSGIEIEPLRKFQVIRDLVVKRSQ